MVKSGQESRKSILSSPPVWGKQICNWGSAESKKIIEFLQQNKIYETCHKAALEFVEDLQKFISFEPIEKYPTIQKIWKKELVDLFRNSPELKFNYTVPNIDEVIRFFGVTLMPNKPQLRQVKERL